MSDATQNPSAPAANPSVGRSWAGKTGAVANGAAKVFREFKWGLLTLFLLMVVVIGLVYDGNPKKEAVAKAAPEAAAPDNATLLPDQGSEPGMPALTDESQPPVTPGYAGDRNLGNYETTPVGPIGRSSAPATPRSLGNEVGRLRPPVPSGPSAGGLAHLTQPDVTPRLTPVAPVSGATCTVEAGDTLSSIAQKHYPGQVQAGIRALADANKDLFSDPKRLRSGMVLKVPALASAPVAISEVGAGTKKEAVAEAHPTVSSPDPSGTYTVQAGDTLERIARKVFKDGNRWREIYEWNREQLSDPSHLRIGQKLNVADQGKAPEGNKGEKVEKAEKPKSSKKEHVVAEQEEKSVSKATSMERSSPAPEWMP